MSIADFVKTAKTAREAHTTQQSGTPHNSVITANLGVYRVIDDAVVFALLEREGNLLFDERFQRKAYANSRRREVTHVDDVMKEFVLAAVDAKKAVEVSYSRIRLKWEADNFYYIESGEENTADENKLLEQVFGTTNLGSGRRVYLLPAFQVKHALREHPEDILICGCYAENTYFFAQGHAAVASTFSGLLGVLDANLG